MDFKNELSQEITRTLISTFMSIVTDSKIGGTKDPKEEFKKLVLGIKNIREVLQEDFISYNLFHSARSNFEWGGEKFERLELSRKIVDDFTLDVVIENTDKTIKIIDTKKQIEIIIELDKERPRFEGELADFLYLFYENSHLNLDEIEEKWNKEDFEGMTFSDII